MATTISDLPEELIGEILAKVQLTSLKAMRSTCKKWNALSKNQIFGKASGNQFLGFMMMDCRFFSMKFDLQGIRNDDDFVVPSIKQIRLLKQVNISEVFHCDGLLLCVTQDKSRLVVWNPYLGQTRWIQPIHYFNRFDQYVFGYDDNKKRNHKIVRFSDDYDNKYRDKKCEIYDFNSNSWSALDVILDIWFYQSGVSLKGNTYFIALEHLKKVTELDEDFLICFDFTTERFGPRLLLPFHSNFGENVTLSCVREEQLSVLYQSSTISKMMEIWITTKIEPNEVSWSKFLKVDITPLNGFPENFEAWSFFIDEEKKVAVVSKKDSYDRTETVVYIIGQDGYFKSVTIGEGLNLEKPDKFNNTVYPPEFSSYVPSLVQLQTKQQRKRKQRDF